MQVQRVLSRVDNGPLVIPLPESFHHHRVEVIVLTLEENEPEPIQRQPHPDIAGQVKIHSDILTSAPEQDWDLSR
ncbi:hypothetical protein [Candidatus Symbiobacter mobilis]|uniref:Uncharacterized protein n=1 Tax=Candidatus Symbiobacter mobilis CR TaxID=946483 RepID=U5N623_9BURK|nr:hypothetical protein [Candidatus Symbiobacter mobilis]AGX86946.1 hypothetical protein Cenrod_0842 [Candidatus Symbiobacter mobilis CR]